MGGFVYFLLGLYAILIGSVVTLTLWLCIKKIQSFGMAFLIWGSAVIITYFIMYILQSYSIPIIR